MKPIGEGTLIVIPTYKEAEGIESMLVKLLAANSLWHVLIVDDSSPDGTAAIVRNEAEKDRRVHLLPREGSRSFGASLLAGIAWAIERDYEICLNMDADESHDVKEVEKVLRPLRDGFDSAIGSRYLNGVRVRNWPFRRLALSRTAGWLLRVLVGIPLSDPTSGFRTYKLSVLDRIELGDVRSDGYAFCFELNERLWRHTRLQEVPITFTERTVGASKMGPGMIVEAVGRMVQLASRRRIGSYRKT